MEVSELMLMSNIYAQHIFLLLRIDNFDIQFNSLRAFHIPPE